MAAVPHAPRGSRPAVLGVALLAGLTACSGTSSGADAVVQPGPSSSAPACTRLLNRLPATLLGLKRADSAARGATAWGEQAGRTVVLRCGVTPLGPTTLMCGEYDGVDWVSDETEKAYVFTTYGREPAVELTVPKTVDRDAAAGAPVPLTAAVKPLPQTRHCTDLADTPSS